MEIDLIKENGVVRMEKSFDFLCSLLRNGKYTLSIKRKTSPRSLNQNALMWLWFKCLEDEFGQPKEDYHLYYCQKFLSRHMRVGDRVEMVAGRTSALNTEQFTTFLKQVQADAASELGVNLPLPEDQFFSAFIDEYQNK